MDEGFEAIRGEVRQGLVAVAVVAFRVWIDDVLVPPLGNADLVPAFGFDGAISYTPDALIVQK